MARKQRMKGGARQTITSLPVYVQALLPTPVTNDAKNLQPYPSQLARNSPGLAASASLLPTPLASMQNGEQAIDRFAKNKRLGEHRPTIGSLNPAWVGWLMGFPIGWTECDASAMQSCPRSPSTSVA